MKIHYPAFTLAEITVAMLIASIVISASLYALETLSSTSNQWETFQRQNLEINEAMQAVERDFDFARAVFPVDSQIIMQGDSSALVYTFYPCLTRQSGTIKDTLLHSTLSWHYTLLPSTSLIDTISFSFTYQGDSLPRTLIKTYPFADIAPYRNGNTN